MPSITAEQHSELVIVCEGVETVFYPTDVAGLIKGVAETNHEPTLAWCRSRPSHFTITGGVDADSGDGDNVKGAKATALCIETVVAPTPKPRRRGRKPKETT